MVDLVDFEDQAISPLGRRFAPGQICANALSSLLPKYIHPTIVQATLSAQQKASDWQNEQFDGQINFVLASILTASIHSTLSILSDNQHCKYNKTVLSLVMTQPITPHF